MHLNDNEFEVTATEFKKNLGKYLDQAISLKETVINKNGNRIARLVPYVQDYTGYLLAKDEVASYRTKTISYDEFLAISEKSEVRMEYLNGELIMMSSPNSFHQEAVGNLHYMLKLYFKGKPCKVLLAPFEVTLYKKDINTPDVLQPDLLVICDGEEHLNEKGRYDGVPTLVIEVLSPSTRSRDMLDKLNTFMRSGCKEYWVVDIEHRRVLQYTFLDCEINNYDIFTYQDSFMSYAFKELTVCVKDIFEG